MFGNLENGIPLLEEVDLSATLRKIEEYAPNTFYLLKHAAENQRPRGFKDVSHNRITSIASILSVGRARNSGNFLLRSLGLYLYTSGVFRNKLRYNPKSGSGYQTAIASVILHYFPNLVQGRNFRYYHNRDFRPVDTRPRNMHRPLKARMLAELVKRRRIQGCSAAEPWLAA